MSEVDPAINKYDFSDERIISNSSLGSKHGFITQICLDIMEPCLEQQ